MHHPVFLHRRPCREARVVGGTGREHEAGALVDAAELSGDDVLGGFQVQPLLGLVVSLRHGPPVLAVLDTGICRKAYSDGTGLTSGVGGWDMAKQRAWTTEEAREFLLTGKRPTTEGADFLAGEWVEVVSSNVAAISYDGVAQYIKVRYRSGEEWRYGRFDVDRALEFLRAVSYGSWLWDNVRVRGTKHLHKVHAVQIA